MRRAHFMIHVHFFIWSSVLDSLSSLIFRTMPLDKESHKIEDNLWIYVT
jgi:hypothetical protein